MADIDVIRTARKQRQCDTHSPACVRAIKPGDRYVYHSLPPWGEMGNESWWHARSCGPCTVRYGRPLADQFATADTTQEDR